MCIFIFLFQIDANKGYLQCGTKTTGQRIISRHRIYRKCFLQSCSSEQSELLSINKWDSTRQNQLVASQKTDKTALLGSLFRANAGSLFRAFKCYSLDWNEWIEDSLPARFRKLGWHKPYDRFSLAIAQIWNWFSRFSQSSFLVDFPVLNFL